MAKMHPRILFLTLLLLLEASRVQSQRSLLAKLQKERKTGGGILAKAEEVHGKSLPVSPVLNSEVVWGTAFALLLGLAAITLGEWRVVPAETGACGSNISDNNIMAVHANV